MPGTLKVEWMHIFADQESSELNVSFYLSFMVYLTNHRCIQST